METKLKQHIRGYIDLIRPFTLLAPIIVSICIMIASFFYNKVATDLFPTLFGVILPASFSLALLTGASNALNQVADLEADRISKPYRPIPKGTVSISEAKVISLILYLSSVLLSIFIGTIFTVFILLIVIFTVTYSLPPRLKDYLFLNQLWIGVPRGLLGILASWSVFGNVLSPLALAIGLIAMFFLIGGSITKDIVDSEADKKTGTRTLINTYGIKNAAILSLPFMFFPFAYIPILISSGVLHPYLWLLTFLAIPAYFVFHLMIKHDKKDRLLENTPCWTLMYVTYFVFAFGFSTLTVLASVITY